MNSAAQIAEIGDDEDRLDLVFAYVVRDKLTKRLVAFLMLPDGESLFHHVDETANPDECEYAVLLSLSLLWNEDAGPRFPDDISEELSPPPSCGHAGLEAIRAIEFWYPVTNIDGWVYFIRAGEFVKIGYSLDVGRRLTRLQVSSPAKMELLLQVPGNKEDEERYHLKFRKQYERGEWFRFEGELKEFLESAE